MTSIENAICNTICPAIDYSRLLINNGFSMDNDFSKRVSLNLLEQLFIKNKSIETYSSIGQAELKDVDKTPFKFKIYYRPSKIQDPKIIKATNLILVADISDTQFNIVDFIGAHNRKIFLKSHFSGFTGHKIIIPFELTTVLTGSLGNVSKEFAFVHNPLAHCFRNAIQPIGIVGLAVGGDIDRIIGYISNPGLIADYFVNRNDNLTLSRLEYDTKLALNLLKCEYSVKVNDKVLHSLSVYDNFIQKNAANALTTGVGD